MTTSIKKFNNRARLRLFLLIPFVPACFALLPQAQAACQQGLLNEREHRLGWVSALDLEGRTIRIVDAHGYGKRFVVRADEMLTAYTELKGPFTSSR